MSKRCSNGRRWAWLAPALLVCIQANAQAQQAYPGFPYQSNFATLSDFENRRIHYLDEGPRDAPPVIMLHGIPTSAYLWRNVIPSLSDDYRVIVPDLVNFGLSDKITDTSLTNAERFGLDTTTNHFDAFVEELGLEDYSLVIHDSGGLVGFNHAARNPDQIASLAFFETAPFPFPSIAAADQFEGEFGPFFVDATTDADAGAQRLLVDNEFIEGALFDASYGLISPKTVLSEADKEIYRAPFPTPESRQALWEGGPRSVAFADTTGLFEYDPLVNPDLPGDEPLPHRDIAAYVQWGEFLMTSEDVPKLAIAGNVGFAFTPEFLPVLEQSVANLQTAVIGDELPDNFSLSDPSFDSSEFDLGFHYLQEDLPIELGSELRTFFDSTVGVPEPSSVTLLMPAALGLALTRRRRAT